MGTTRRGSLKTIPRLNTGVCDVLRSPPVRRQDVCYLPKPALKRCLLLRYCRGLADIEAGISCWTPPRSKRAYLHKPRCGSQSSIPARQASHGHLMLLDGNA